MSEHKVIERDGYEVTFYPAAYKGRPVITILSPGRTRTSDFYLSGYVWRELQTKKRAPSFVEHKLKELFQEFTN